MAFDIDGARSAGYSDAEIADHLGKASGFDVAGAQKAGYEPAEIVAHLSSLKKPATAKPRGEIDYGNPQGFGASGILDMPVKAGGMGSVLESRAADRPLDPLTLDQLRASEKTPVPGIGAQYAEPIVGKTTPVSRDGIIGRAGALVGSQVDSYSAGLGYKVGDAASAVGADKVAANMRGRASTLQERSDATNKSVSLSADGNFEKYAPQILAVFPTMAVAAATGGLPVMFGIAEFQSYAEGRKAGLTPAMALGRAVPMASAEVIGEKLGGTGKLLAALEKAAIKGGSVESLKELSGRLAASGLREVPSEEATYAMQFGIDKAPGIGLKPNAGMDDFIEGAKDTAIVAAGAGGIMAGGSMATSRMAARGQPAASLPPPGLITPQPDPVAAIASATTVDEAISAAQSAVSTKAVDNIGAILASSQPQGLINSPAPLSPDVAATTQSITDLEAANVSPSPAIPPVAAGAAGSGMPEPAPSLEAGLGAESVAGPALDAGRVPGQPNGDSVSLDAAAKPADAVDQRLIPVSKRAPAITPTDVQNPTQTSAQSGAATQAATGQAPKVAATPAAGQPTAGIAPGAGAVQAAGVAGNNGKTRQATDQERTIAEKAMPALDLNRRPTGWKSVPVANGNGVILVSFDGKTAVPFINDQPSSGANAARMRAQAQGYAIDNILQVAGDAPPDKSAVTAASELRQKSTSEPEAPTAEVPRETPAGPQRLGRNNIPISEGGKPFKTKLAATKAKALQPMLRVVKGEGGYVLVDKTPAQLAAQAKATKRLANPQTSQPGQPIPAHAFIAAAGGLSKGEQADMGMGENPKVGNRRPFAGTGRGMTIERATEKLIEEGYLPEDAGHDQARALIKRSLTDPQYTPEGTERMAETAQEARFADHLQAQQEATQEDPDFDPFPDMGYVDTDFAGTGFADSTAAIQEEVTALLAMADAMGLDGDEIMSDADYATRGKTNQEYYEHAKSALEAAIAEGNRNRSQNNGQQSDAPASGEQGSAASAEVSGEGVGQEQTLAALRDELRAAASTTETKGSIGIQVGSGIKFVGFDFALNVAQRAIDAGVRAVPFQLHNETNIRLGDTSRILAAISSGLTGQTNAEILAEQERIAQADKDKAKAEREAAATDTRRANMSESERRAADILAEREVAKKAEVDAAGENFGLGDVPPTPVDKKVTAKQKRGQGSVFDAPATPASEMSAAELMRAAADRLDADAAKAGDPKSDAGTTSGSKAKIEDFGEKLEGARKDYAAKLKDAETVDIAAEPLSKSWPEPDYKKLLDGGASPYIVAFVHAARDMIPTKPKQSWKLKRYVEQVQQLRSFAAQMLDGRIDPTQVQDQLSKFASLQKEMSSAIELYQLVGHAKSLKGMEIDRGEYSFYDGVKHDTLKVLWTIGQKYSPFSKETVSAPTREAALEAFAKKYQDLADSPSDKKGTTFAVYSGGGKYYVGKKLGKDVAKLKTFDTVADARKYLAENQAELETMLARYKDTPFERSNENQPRIGEDHRNGARVTPEVFTDAFGFRGVQFGNYVEDSRRQADLNNAYDALSDLSAVIGVPTRALSLDGKLGIAFGARGKGGKNPASAHYEEDQTVINLTKNNGAGSLAHEWFHAVDNYFARLKEGKGDYITNGVINPGMRPEMAKAFDRLMTTIRMSGVRTRSRELDKRRSSPYWSGGEEMAARSFESYIIAKLQDQNASNDYLANVVGEDYWKALDALMGHDGVDSYPYPTEKEMGPIREAFDNFFQTIQTKESADGNVAMFARTQAEADAFRRYYSTPTGLPVSEVQKITSELSAKWTDGPSIRVVASPADFPIPTPSDVRGLIHNGAVYIAANNHRNRDGVARTLAHEVIGHFGLWKILGAEGKRTFERNLQFALKAGNVPLNKIAEKVKRLYVDEKKVFNLSASSFASEIAAFVVEEAIDKKTGEFKPGFGMAKAVYARLAEWLREKGITIKFTNAELQGMLVNAMRGLEGGRRLEGGMQGAVAAARDGPSDVASTLLELGKMESLFQLPKSNQNDMAGIAEDKDLTAVPVDRNASQDSKVWMLANTTPADAKNVRSWMVTTPTGQLATITDNNGRVYINVSAIGEGNGGSAVYDLAANYAVNNGLKFIGDPNGVSKSAMRRRLENMLSSAVKYGTTDHLEPHPDQLAGNAEIGVPALKWTDGDTLGNMAAMVDVSIKATEYANPISTQLLDFDAGTQSFRDGRGERIANEDLAGYLSDVLSFEPRQAGAGGAGRTTLQRTALYKALLQSEGARRALLDAVRGQQDRSGPRAGSALDGSFYSRGPSDGVSQTDTPAFKRWFGDSKVVDADGNRAFKSRVLDFTFGKYGAGKNIDRIDTDGMLAATTKKPVRPIFIMRGTFGRPKFLEAMDEAKAAGIEFDKMYVYADVGTYSGKAIDFTRLDNALPDGELDALDLVSSGKTPMLERRPDGNATDAKPIADLFKSKAFRLQGLGGLDVPAQREVLHGVLALGDDLKVLRAVVNLLPVEVVDILARENLATESLFRDESVLKKLLSADLKGSVATAVDIADALVGAVATLSAEGARPGSGMAGRRGKYNTALGANIADGFHESIVNQDASGNNGDFDPTNSNIAFSRGVADNAFEADPKEEVNSPWRDATGRMHFAPGQWLFDQIGKAAHPLLVRAGMKAPTPELRRQLRQMKIEVEKAQETALAIARETTKLSEAERAMVSDLVEKELKVGVIPPAHAVKLAAMINDAMGKQTDQLVNLGMLQADTAERLRGKYLPRYYEPKLRDKIDRVGGAWADSLRNMTRRPSAMKGIKGNNLKGRGLYETIAESDLKNYEALGWEVRDPDYTPSLPSVDGTVQVWRDFNPAEREKMGEIRDAGFRFVMGYMQSQKDIALGKMFERLAADPEQSSRLAKEGYVQVPTTTVSGTGVKVYGRLAGRWVPTETLSQLSNIEESTSEAWQMYRKALAIWKMGKALALDTPIPTPSGWTTMGEVKEGDQVFDEKGQPCSVTFATGVQLERECYEVEFSDGSKIVADAEHLWFTIKAAKGGIRSTKQILNTLKEATRGDNKHSIPVAGALQIAEVKLPIPPYALGAWLGDGNSASAAICAGSSDADETTANIRASGLAVGAYQIDRRNGVVTFGIRYTDASLKRCEGLQPTMRAMNLLGNKHIPAIYLRGSELQRMELLQGLMDTDGSISAEGRMCEFTTILPALRDGVMELLRSLGFKPQFVSHRAMIGDKDFGVSWRISFRGYADRPVFKMARKAARLLPAPETRQRSGTRQIVAVRPIPSVPVRCIEVDSESHLYLAGESMIPTHNTAMNPVSHVNNIVSNLSNAHFAGVSYHRGDKYIAAARDFVKKSPMMTEAKENGLFLGTLSDAELMNSLPEELKILAQRQESTATKVARTGFDIMTMFLRKPMGAAYQAEDTFFRYLIYKDARDRGMDPQDSVDYAQRYIFTYDDLPKGARMVRDFGIPFFSYTYKAVPMLLHTALTHPARLAAPAAVLWAVNAAAYAIATGDDEDDWKDSLEKYLTDPEFRAKAREREKLEREFLPPWMKGTTSLLSPKTIRLGMDEVTKLPLFIDVSRIIPGGDLFDVSPNAGGIPLPQPITPSNPLFTTAVAMLGNKDLFRGKDLIDKNDTTGEATEKRLDWLWTQLSPAVAVGNYHWERGMNALAQASGGEVKWVPDVLGGDATGIGKDGLPVQPKYAAMQTFGIKVRPMDLDTSASIDKNMQNKMVRDIDTEMRALNRLRAKGAVSDRTVDKARDLADVKKQRLRDGLSVDGDEKN